MNKNESKVMYGLLLKSDEIEKLELTEKELTELSKMYVLDDEFLTSLPEGKVSIFKRGKFSGPLQEESNLIDEELRHLKLRLESLKEEEESLSNLLLNNELTEEENKVYRVLLTNTKTKIFRQIKKILVTTLKHDIVLRTFIGIHK